MNQTTIVITEHEGHFNINAITTFDGIKYPMVSWSNNVNEKEILKTIQDRMKCMTDPVFRERKI